MKKFLVLAFLCAVAFAPLASAQTYVTKVHGDGPDKLVVENGGELELQQGATFDVKTDLTLTDESTGGNAGAQNVITGLPNLSMVALGTMTNGSTETTAYMDDTPTGEWTEVDAGTAVALTADSTYYRVGSKSLKIAFTAAAVAGDGTSLTVSSDDMSSNESIGFWIYSSSALSAGDLVITLDDDDASSDPTANVPAVATANKWTWVEADISGCDGGGTDCNAVTAVTVTLSTAGAAAHGALNVYLDGVYKWDAADEEALGVNLVQDGVLSVMTTATAAGSANTQALEVLYTDYFVHYESGNDFLVTIADHSANSGVALVAHQ